MAGTKRGEPGFGVGYGELAGRPPVPGTRGLTIDTCDTGHQAIAFAGTCPICRDNGRHGRRDGGPPPAQGRNLYAADLVHLLRAHFGGAGASR